MSPDSDDQPRSVAVTQLEALGLSTYAARAFVALVGLGGGTAQEVSDASDVPRTRVYDAAEELREHGLVDVQQSTPKRFWPTSVETTGRYFEREYTHRVDRLTEALDGLESPSRTEEQRGVWTVTGRETVTDRTLDFLESATEEIVFMTVSELLTDEVTAHLQAASERDVPIKLATMSQPVEDGLHEAVPEAELFDSLWEWSDTPAGRLLMVDEEKTLVSVLTDADGASSEPCAETAIWGTGEMNNLVVVLRAMFAWRLGDGSDD